MSEAVPKSLQWRPLKRSRHCFEMIDGVVAVYADESRELQLFAPPGDSFEFFSDMHRQGSCHVQRSSAQCLSKLSSAALARHQGLVLRMQ